MKKWFITIILGCIIPFSGCSVNQSTTPEYVADVWSEIPRPAFSLIAELPAGAALTEETSTGSYYIHRDYEIITEIFPAVSPEEAISHLTGRTDAPVISLLVGSYPQEEYRFSWTAAGEDGAVACSCAMLFDGSHCYSLQIQCPLDMEADYRPQFYEILSGIRLESN